MHLSPAQTAPRPFRPQDANGANESARHGHELSNARTNRTLAEIIASRRRDQEPEQRQEDRMRKLATILAGAGAMCALAAAAHAQVVLKASHQFPGGKGDARDEMVQIIGREVKAANVGLEVQIYPGASLFKP